MTTTTTQTKTSEKKKRSPNKPSHFKANDILRSNLLDNEFVLEKVVKGKYHLKSRTESGKDSILDRVYVDKHFTKIGEVFEMGGDAYLALTGDQRELARKLGYNAMFAERKKVQEIYDYVAQMKGRQAVVAMTGLAMLQNFFACYIAENFDPKSKKKKS